MTAADHAAPDHAAPDRHQPTTVDRVGPGGGVASDSAFGVALVTLWQQVADAGGAVGFAPPVLRSDVAARAAGLVDDLRTGRLIGVAVNRAHRLIGVAFLRPGRGTRQHTGRIELVMVGTAHVRAGLGTQMVDELLSLTRGTGLERVDVEVQDGAQLDVFFGSFGFEVCGRRSGWIRLNSGDDVDELVMEVVL